MIIYIPFRILVFFLKLLPFFLYPEVSKIIGKIVFSTMGKTRKRITKNIEIAFGNKYSIEERKNICQQVLSNIILNFLELDQLTKLKKEKLMKMAEIEGEEILKNLLRENKGIVAICAHLGNFPIAQTILNKKGYPINMIVRDTNNKYLARYVKNWRKKMSLPAISKWNLKKAIDEAQKWIKKREFYVFILTSTIKRVLNVICLGNLFQHPLALLFLQKNMIHLLSEFSHLKRVLENIKLL
jgi:KDO2-lipid IV(A) lauroyltransferase